MPSNTPRIDKLESYNNLIINGAMDFWQRGTSFAAVANGAYTADRFSVQRGGSMVGTVSRSASVPAVAQSGFASQYSWLYTVTTAQATLGASDGFRLRYHLEGQDYAAIAGGQSARLQFWVRSSKIGLYSVVLMNSAGDRYYATTYNISAANTWEKKTIDFTTDSAGTWLLDNGRGLTVIWSLGEGSSGQTSNINSWQAGLANSASGQVNVNDTIGATFQLAQVMFVPGSFASTAELTFKRAGRTIQQELQMCQRYYEKSYDINTAPGTSTVEGLFISYQNQGAPTTVSYLGSFIFFKVPKRITATGYTAYVYDNLGNGGTGAAMKCIRGTTNVSNATNQTASINSSVSNMFTLAVSSGSGTAGNDIGFHWAVDAEL